MKVLIDECLPKRLTRELPGHYARMVQQMGWSGRKNGLLLRSMAENQFEGFITADKNLPFQQNMSGLPIVLIILRVESNRYRHIAPLLPLVLEALGAASRGDVIRLNAPEPPAPTPAA